MRVSTLLTTLVSLASLTNAEPGEVWTCTHPLGEVGGGCGRMLALDHCVDLSSGMAGHVRAITQKQGAICYYYPQKGCSTGQRSLEIDSRGGDFVQDIAEKVGRQIVSVHCFRRFKAGAGMGDEVSSGTEMQTRSEAVVDINTPSSIDSSTVADPVGPSDLVICQDLRQKDALCIAFNATNICVPLDPPLVHTVRGIYQAQGTVCKFYEHDCSPRHSVLTINSLEQIVYLPVDTETGGKLGAVVCRPTWRPEERRQKRSRTLHAAPAAAPRTVISNPHSSTWEGSNTQPLYICRHANLSGRCTFYEEPTCLNNPFGPEAVEPIQSLKVREGWRCAFYHEPNCAASSPPNYEEARGADLLVSEVGYSVVSMSCSRNPVVENNGITTTVTATPAEAGVEAKINDRAASEQANRHFPGTTFICTAPHYSNCHVNPNALDRCVTFAGLDGIGALHSLKQAAGVVCRWYRYTDCDEEVGDANPLVIDSRGGFMGRPELGMDAGRFRSVTCDKGVDEEVEG